jgi:hypothetical protein
MIAGSGADPANYTAIKTAIRSFGPVIGSYFHDNSYFHTDRNIYYYPNCTETAKSFHLYCRLG